MPLTVPTHPVAVLPLKLWRPRWFDGVALVLGSIAPDVAYALDGYGVTIHSHQWHALLWWNLPLVLVGARLVRRAAPVVVAHLPRGGPLALRDYGLLATVRHPWHVTVASALLGAASHIVWDAFTHPTLDGGAVPFPALHRTALAGRPWWDALSTISDLIGFATAALLVLAVGRSRRLPAWHGPAAAPPATPAAAPPATPAVVPHPARFWTTAAVVTAAGLASLPFQPIRYFHDQAVRCLLIAGTAALAGAWAAGTRPVCPRPAPGYPQGRGATSGHGPRRRDLPGQRRQR